MSFDNSFNSNNAPTDNYNDEDPANEFLEREKRELGEITGDEFGNSLGDSRNSLNNGAYSPPSNSRSPIPPNESASPYDALSQLNEPETTRKWREEFTARISKKDSDEETKRKEMREQAKKELDDFHKQRLEQLERSKEQNRLNNRKLEEDLLKNSANSTSNGKSNDWEKITSLCEFNPKNNRSQKDLTRYRSVLLQLKQQQTSGK